MKERVEVRHGKLPVILVAPHGADDTYTGELTKACADRLDCSAIINWGFERADVVDVLNDRADCNRIDHIEQDVVREEFLDQIVRLRNRLSFAIPQGKKPYVYIYYIHGFGKQVEEAMKTKIDLILGYGESEIKPSYTCPQWIIDMLIHEWEENIYTVGDVFCGKPGGPYAARMKNNLCQLYTKHMNDTFVRSAQIEVCQRLRCNKQTAMWTGSVLANPLREILSSDHFDLVIDRKYV